MEKRMKRIIAIILVLLTLSFAMEPIVSWEPGVSAQTTTRRRVRRHKRTFWQRHRDKLTVGATTATGAAIGGLAGGKKGAGIGALAGAGSGALYTYKIRKRHRRHRRY
jgi:uncharacterized protein YcfJ